MKTPQTKWSLVKTASFGKGLMSGRIPFYNQQKCQLLIIKFTPELSVVMSVIVSAALNWWVKPLKRRCDGRLRRHLRLLTGHKVQLKGTET